MKAVIVMNQRAVVERSSSTSDTGGGFTKEWTTVNTIRCRVWSVSAIEIIASGRPESINTRIVLTPRNADVKVGDRLVSITDRKGTVLFSGPLMVNAINEKPDHLQLTTQVTT